MPRLRDYPDEASVRKPGCIEPVFYFVCGEPSLTNPPRPKGYILIAPYSGCPAPEGYRTEYAETLSQVDALEKVLVAQEHEATQREAQHEASIIAGKEQEIRDSLYAKMTSGSTDEYEKEFIRLYLQLRDDRKRAHYRQRYLERTAYLWARHNDTPKGRGVGEETVDVDRIKL